MAQFREAPTLVVVQTQSSPSEPRFQHAILFAEKRDHVLLVTLVLGASLNDCDRALA